MLFTPFRALCLLGTAAIGLSACGHHGAHRGSGDGQATAQPGNVALASGETKSTVAVPTLADGPDVCFRAVSKQLGGNMMVSEITSLFSVGSEIDSSSRQPKGQLELCSVQYQSPSDPRKLVQRTLNLANGSFDPPRPVEITVMGGGEASFRLDSYLIPLSKINAAGLASIMEAQKSKLSGVYSRYAWSGIGLSPPDSFNNTHVLRLDVVGRLASNDIKKNGYASVTTDAKTIKTDFLTS